MTNSQIFLTIHQRQDYTRTMKALITSSFERMVSFAALLVLLLVPPTALAESKVVGGSLHGDRMIVQYSVLNSGRHILGVSEKVHTPGQRAREKTVQSVDLNIKNGETLAPYNGFKCRTQKNEFVYGIIAENASQKIDIHPLRAWVVDEINLKLLPVKNIATINCEWAPNGDDGKTEN